MTVKQQLSAQDVDVSRFEYEDATVLAADFGNAASSSVEVVDDTVIAVVDGEQYDIELEGDAEVFMRNGVLTIEVRE